jgi:hypothetical protein
MDNLSKSADQILVQLVYLMQHFEVIKNQNMENATAI